MDELNRVHLQIFDCLLARILLDKSRQLLGLANVSGGESASAMIDHVRNKMSPLLKLYVLRRLVDYNLVDEALMLVDSPADTLTMLEIITDTKQRLLLKQDEYVDLREVLDKCDCSSLANVGVSEKNIVDLDSKCADLFTRIDMEESSRVWNAYIKFYLAKVGSSGSLETRIRDLIQASKSIRTAETFYKALEDNQMLVENHHSHTFPDLFLMDLLEKVVDGQEQMGEAK